MHKLRTYPFHFYKLLNALSIDVAVGACVTAVFVASVLQLSISIAALFSLGIAVLLIYTFDHLMDASRITHVPHTYRHMLHQRYFGLIRKWMVSLAIIQLFLLFYLPWKIFLGGLLLAAIVGLYFCILWKWRFRYIYHKEVLVALVYSIGIFLPSFENQTGFPNAGILFMQIFLLAFINLLIFSIIEQKTDQKDRQLSLALTFRSRSLQLLVIFLFLLSIALALYSIASKSGISAQLIIVLMNIVLGFLLRMPQRWKDRDLHRMIGDGIFFLPLFYLLLN